MLSPAQAIDARNAEARFRARYRAQVEARADRLPASVSAAIMAGWDARYPVSPVGLTSAQMREANGFARDAAGQFGASRVAAAYDEQRIRDHAENYSMLCAAMSSLTACRVFAAGMGIEPPAAPNMTPESERARWMDAGWWRRQLRRAWTRRSEDGMRALGLIRKGKQPYASDEAVEHRSARQRRTREWLDSRVMVNGEGEQLEMLQLHDRSLANPALRRGEFMCRMRGFEGIARDLGHVAQFWTLTTPSRFHAQHAGGGANPAWQADRATIRDGQQWLRTMWARARAKLARLSVLFYGFRVAEPHHDGTPHWHMVLFVKPSSAGQLRQVLRHVWLADSGSEPGAAEHRAKCIDIDPEQGSATGYVAKYVSKNIDAAGAIGAEVSDETGEPVSEGVQRVAAWASAHGIRQFQQVGGPPVGLWRECRRVREAVRDSDIERARAAADRGDWRAFIYALSFDHIKAGRRVGLKLEREEDTRTRYREAGPNGWVEQVHGVAASVQANTYGEECRARVIGLRYAGKVVLTRPHRWRIERKCASASSARSGVGTTSISSAAASVVAASGHTRCLSSGFRSDLGPVAITVRSDGAPAIGAPIAWTAAESSQAGPLNG